MNGEIVVSDSGSQCVQVFDRDGAFIQRVKCPGRLCGIAVSSEGHVWVADTDNRSIVVLGAVTT